MIKTGNRIVRNVTYLSVAQRESIHSYLQGSVRAWCKNRPNEWFAARDFLGGLNFDWGGTPMEVLFRRYEKSKAKKAAIRAAGKDAGWLLKAVILADSRNFETRREYKTRQYRWLR